MDLENKLLSSFILFEETVDTSTFVHDIRTEALHLFEKKGFPKKKDEAWKYTSLNKLLKAGHSVFPKEEESVSLNYSEAKPHMLHNIDSYKIVFINGMYSSFLSETSHDNGKDICILSSALSKSRYKEKISTYYNHTIDQNDTFSQLNTAFAKEGAYIYIPKNISLEKPIQIINYVTGIKEPYLAQPRNLIILEENSTAQIIETHKNLTQEPILTNAVTEIFLEKEACLEYFKIQSDANTASLIDNTFISQQDKSNCAVYTFSLGGNLVRNNLNFYQNGERINSTLKGLTLISDKSHIDHYTLVHHQKPNCESHQDYKGIYMNQSTGVFNGKIIVDKVAQKTNAFQQNDNILIDDKSTVNTKPQLEIFADDVRCSHGCTVGQLDYDALFYLRSRGIPINEAKGLLLYAFSNSILEDIKILELKQKINKAIAQKLNINLSVGI